LQVLFGSGKEFLKRPNQPIPVQVPASGNDKRFVSPFLKHAEEIFSAARQPGAENCEMAILVSAEGAIHVLPASGWELESLRIDRGARAAYRITRQGGSVRLEARSAGESCLFEAQKPAPAWRAGLPDFPQYRLQ